MPTKKKPRRSGNAQFDELNRLLEDIRSDLPKARKRLLNEINASWAELPDWPGQEAANRIRLLDERRKEATEASTATRRGSRDENMAKLASMTPGERVARGNIGPTPAMRATFQ